MTHAHAGALDRARLSSRSGRRSGARVWAMILLALGVGVLLVRAIGVDVLAAAIAATFSEDGELSERNRAWLDAALLRSALGLLLLSALCFSAAHQRTAARLRGWFLTDPIPSAGRFSARPTVVLAASTTLGLLILLLWEIHSATPLRLPWLFEKEGPLELATFLLFIAGALLCAAAARNYVRGRRDRMGGALAATFAFLGVGLFLVGMEEISWGQTYLQWRTPESWAAINSQQETTVHNLLDQRTLHVVERLLILICAPVALLAAAVGRMSRRPYLLAAAPHPSTAPILVLVSYAAYRHHLEIPEILLAIFVVCYALRAYAGSRCS